MSDAAEVGVPSEAPSEEVVTIAAVPDAPAVETPEPAKEAPKVEFDEAQQEVFNREVGKKVSNTKVAEQERDAARAELAELKAAQPQDERPVIPELPSVGDPDYETLMEARDTALVASTNFDAAERTASENNLATQRATQAKQLETFKATMQTYTDKAETLNIPAEDLTAAGNTLTPFNIQRDTLEHILFDDSGPALTVYLANNTQEAEKVAGMLPTKAAVYLENTVKPLALKSLKVDSSDDAPNPPSQVKSEAAGGESLGGGKIW